MVERTSGRQKAFDIQRLMYRVAARNISLLTPNPEAYRQQLTALYTIKRKRKEVQPTSSNPVLTGDEFVAVEQLMSMDDDFLIRETVNRDEEGK
jgi:hypothetical protein